MRPTPLLLHVPPLLLIVGPACRAAAALRYNGARPSNQMYRRGRAFTKRGGLTPQRFPYASPYENGLLEAVCVQMAWSPVAVVQSNAVYLRGATQNGFTCKVILGAVVSATHAIWQFPRHALGPGITNLI